MVDVFKVVRGGFRCVEGFRKSKDDKFLSPAEFKALLDAARADTRRYGSDAYCLFSMSGNFGLRCSEALDLRFDDFRTLQHGYFRVRTRKKRRVLEDRVYTGTAGGQLVREIVECRRRLSDEFLFPFSQRTARYLFAYYADRAGISPNVSFHSLRHTAARMMLIATGGGDPLKGSMRIVRAFLRHEPSATDFYTDPTPEEMIRAMDLKGVVR